MSDAPLYANVSFKSGGKRTFTYLIPRGMYPMVCPGVRVRASFRGKSKVGFVTDVTEVCEIPAGKVLPLEEVLESESRFPENLMRLIEWASGYYHSTLGATMRAAYPFPSFLRPKEQRMWRMTLSPEEALGWIQKYEKKRPSQAAILKVLLHHHSGLSRKRLLEEAKASESSLVALRKQNCVEDFPVELERRPEVESETFTYQRPVKLTPEQDKALETIVASCQKEEPVTYLLHGVTGSGKTEIYLQAIEQVLETGKTALALVPEISLTPQTADRFRSRFGEHVGIQHSALGEGERFDQWRAARRGNLPVVVGTRSAIFSPLQNLGLIIVDEEHDSSYKQEDPAPRYHARDLAVVRGSMEKCPVVLGSATPSLESAFNASRKKYRLLQLPSRVTGHDLPEIKVVDLRGRSGEEIVLTPELCAAIENHTEHRDQVILFLNRRGYSTLVICRKCGYVFDCPNCSVGMVFHQQFKRLVCHHCMHKEPEPRVCPQCREAFVRFQGWGTEQVTELVEKRFPNLKVQRMDADTTRRKGAHGKILGSFRRGEIDLLVGTQMISKGLDFPQVSLVGIISADVSLNLPDFRAGERTYSLLTQVAGRAGRGERKGEVIIQSFSPRHYSIQMAISQNYPLFYEQELKYRKLISFPPVTRLTNLRIESENEKTGQKAAAELAGRIRGSLDKVEGLKNRLRILGPLPAPIFRIKKIYRWHITLKGPGYEGRQELLDQKSVREFIFSPPKKVKIVVDVDPLNML